MTLHRTWMLLLGSVMFVAAAAQNKLQKPYPDYSPLSDYIPVRTIQSEDAERPDYVNNAKLNYFPPVMNQAGGSCGSASYESYALTYEINSLLRRSGIRTSAQFPSHWLYLLAYQHSDREEVLQKNGIPTANIYGGRTYSNLFGNQEWGDADNGRMQGYDKWLSAMYNRAERIARFRSDLTTEEGRNDLKDWLWNHQGDTAFASGGVACVGVAITGCKTAKTPSSLNNRKNSLSGKTYMTSWGPTYDHSVTIVGYDDRIEFDLNGNGTPGEEEAGERGAWIICNSWGSTWADGGFVYCPYSLGYSVLTDQIPMTPGRWIVRKNYKPERVFRILMDYSRRSEVQLVAGVSENVNASRPQKTVVMSMFNYDGNAKGVSPAPEVPMLGRWADKKLHTEPMEFGFDVTDLTSLVDKAKPLKYFLQINTQSNAVGEGTVYELELRDYLLGAGSIIGAIEESVSIQNGGRTTYLSFTVPGTGSYRPESVTFADGKLSWKAPQESDLGLKRYLIYARGQLVDSVSADQLSYTLPNADAQEYLQVSALYESETGARSESNLTELVSPVVNTRSTSVKLSCDLDGAYLALLKKMTSTYRLTSIDMSEAHIVGGGNYIQDALASADEIGEALFKNCTKLKSIVLPNSLLSIAKGAFTYCSALTKVELPDNLESVGYDAFAYCNQLSQVTIGSKVRNFAQGGFYSSPVKQVYAKPLTPPNLNGPYLFSSRPTIHVYSEALQDYKSSAWATYGTIVGDLEKYIPREVDGIFSSKKERSGGTAYTIDGKPAPEGHHGLLIRDGKKYQSK
ncbi:MAG: leucine-rich repeat protein [Bacteroidaceae bacterium]|nr:leucine-rich repeat protein [Bacteroidaceae bacterium]